MFLEPVFTSLDPYSLWVKTEQNSFYDIDFFVFLVLICKQKEPALALAVPKIWTMDPLHNYCSNLAGNAGSVLTMAHCMNMYLVKHVF